MLHWLPTWQQALGAAAVLAVAALLARRGPLSRGGLLSRRGRLGAALAAEAGVVLALYALWQLAGTLAVGSTAAGLQRGEDLWSLERTLHLPLETRLQAVMLSHPDAVRAMNAYYVYAHYNTLLLTLLWLFVRHRDRYPAARATLALATFTGLALQLIAVAPPRLLGAHHIVDTALRYGQSVYGPVTATGISDQYSAMPSMHVVWAALVAVLVWRSAPQRWRWLGPAHAVLTTLVVVATGNHYWLDAAAGVGVLALALVVVGWIERWWHRRRLQPGDEDEPGRRALLHMHAS